MIGVLYRQGIVSAKSFPLHMGQRAKGNVSNVQCMYSRVCGGEVTWNEENTCG